MAETIVYKIKNFMIAIAIPLILYIVLLVMAPKAMGGLRFLIFSVRRCCPRCWHGEWLLPVNWAYGILQQELM
ncbi:hypothetical protein C807_00565 [Lachnospiraceae bacterium 28-4]|jgi:hypothetical protein|nr:hypothetical protein C807_00565 [Lachnospiraceae bacterium 28-4]